MVNVADRRAGRRRGLARRSWGWVLTDGIVGVTVGFFALVLPFGAVIALSLLLGFGLIVQGVVQFTAGSAAMSRSPGRGWMFFFGTVALIAGLIVLFQPGAGVYAIILGVTLWFFVAGFHELVAAFTLQEDRVLNSIFGVVSLIGGFILIANPGIALSTAAILTGLFFLIRGAGQIVLATRLRKIG